LLSAPLPCPSGGLEQLKLLEGGEDRLQLGGEGNGCQALLLVLVEEADEVGEEDLLGLDYLHLEGVDLNDQDADLGRVAAGGEQGFHLLLPLGDALEERGDGGLAGLEQFTEGGLLGGGELEELDDDLKRRRGIGVAFGGSGVHLLEHGGDAELGKIGHGRRGGRSFRG